MSEADLIADVRERHRSYGVPWTDGKRIRISAGECQCGSNAPCDAIKLADEVERLRDFDDQRKILVAYFRRKVPQAHFCDDWDQLFIGPGDREYEECCSHRTALETGLGCERDSKKPSQQGGVT